MAVNVGEAEVAALESSGELFVIEAELVKDRGVEIVDVNFVFNRVEAEVIGLAMVHAAFDSASGEPHGEGIGMVVPTIGSALGHGSASEFSAEDDEGVFEHAALLEVFDQGGAGLVDILAVLFEPANESAMLVP